MGKPIIYTPEQKERIAELFGAGAAFVVIADDLNMTCNQIKNAIQKARDGDWGEEYIDRFPKRTTCGWKTSPDQTRANYSGRRKKPEKPKPSETLEEAIRHADELGMTYGKYMQMKGL